MNDNKIRMIVFGAVWCGPCKTLEPILKSISEEYPQLIIWKIDIDDFPELTVKHNIRSVPTIIVFQNDKEIIRQIGLIPKNKIIEMFRSLL
jgi:thioredoxin 1